MKFKNIFYLSILSQLKNIYVAPFILAWILIVVNILNFSINLIFIFFISLIIVIYQQFQVISEDRNDGFLEYLIANETPYFKYVIAKTFSQLVVGVMPLFIVFFMFDFNLLNGCVFFIQLCIVTYFASVFASLDKHISNAQIAFVGLPLLSAPIIFLSSFFSEKELSTFYMFLGANLILISAVSMTLFSLKNSSRMSGNFR